MKCPLILAIMMFGINVLGQSPYSETDVRGRKAIPNPSLRESDVHFQKQIVRVINTREKNNLPLRWNKNSLGDVIYRAIEQGKLKAYSSDSLSNTYNTEQVSHRGRKLVEMQYGEGDGIFSDSNLYQQLNPDDIERYAVVENWFFDRRTGESYYRIVAIAPLYNQVVAGISLGEIPLFWIRYSEARQVFVTEPMFNRQNNAAKLSFDDFFEQRLFTSYLAKISNFKDERIIQYKDVTNAKEALFIGQEEDEHVFTLDHDEWEY